MQKEELNLQKRLIELSSISYHRGIVTYSDFLNLNELNILHTIPKHMLSSVYVTYGGYAHAERQMAAFLPDALYLRDYGLKRPGYPFTVLKICPLHEKFAEALTHRDYLGAVLNLGIERGKLGDILVQYKHAFLFVHQKLAGFVAENLTRIRHTAVMAVEEDLCDFSYRPDFQEVTGTVASVRLDSLLSLAYSSSRTKLTSLIEGAKVFVNGKLITSNGCQLKAGDVISVRGMGKFSFEGIQSQTKKGRYYVCIHKYI